MIDNQVERLFQAIQSSDLEKVRQLLNSGVDPNSKNSKHQHPLVLAASLGNVDIVDELLMAGADVNAKSGIAKIPKFNPTISAPSMPGNVSLGEMINEALEDAPNEAKGFYAGFMQFVDTFSGENTANSANVEQEQKVSETANAEFDENEYFDEVEEEDTALIAAITSGHVEAVKALLAAGAELNPKHWNEPVPLVTAAKYGQIEIVRILISAGAEVHKFDWCNDESTPLSMAVKQGQIEIVRTLLDAGAYPLAGLEEAAVRGHIEIMQLLIESGADINSPKDGYAPLMAAANNGQLKMVQMLVEAGADVNAWYEGSNTPLLYAAESGHRDIYDYLYPLVSEDIRKLGEKYINKGVRRKERKQKKDIEDFIHAAMYGNVEAVKAAIAKGIDINAIGSNGQTALMYAASYVHIPVVQALIDAGADLDILSEDGGLGEGMTALMHVAGSFFATGNRAEVVKMLVDAGANINLKGEEGFTALMRAAVAGYVDSTKALIEAGADLNLRDDNGNTAMMWAECNRHHKIVALLKEAGASEKGMDEIALIEAADKGDIEKVRSLLQAGANVNYRQNSTPLCQAAQTGNYEIVKMLIDAGADVNLRASEGYFNPLVNAAYEGYFEIVRALIEAGADVNVRLDIGWNALEYAELGMLEGHHKGGKHAEVIELLKQAGATKSQSF